MSIQNDDLGEIYKDLIQIEKRLRKFDHPTLLEKFKHLKKEFHPLLDKAKNEELTRMDKLKENLASFEKSIE